MARFRDKVGVQAERGFYQEVPLAGAPKSMVSASHNSALHCVFIPLAAATTSYAFPLPPASYVVDYAVNVSVAFSAGTSIEVGTTAASSNMLGTGAFNVLSTGSAIVPSPAPTVHQPANPIGVASVAAFVTILGAPAAGAGTLIVRYINADPYGATLNPSVANKNTLL